MDANELKNKRLSLNLTQNELAMEMKITVRTLIKWESGKHKIPYLAQFFINELLFRHKNRNVI